MIFDNSRRGFIKIAGLGGGFALTHSLLPVRFAFSDTLNNKRLLVVILRGALDGLAAVIPFGDRSYTDARGIMALPQNGDAMVNLDNYFALHIALKPLLPLYEQRQMLIYHAAATSYRDRSHFDAQDLLENGSDKPHTLATGWLNRAIATLSHSPKAMSVGVSIPLILRGGAKIGSWAPSILPNVDEDFLSRVIHLYQSDPLLLDAITRAKEMRDAGNNKGDLVRGQRAFIGIMQKIAEFMAPASGARIATVEIGGWDTHANQGLVKGNLPNNLGILAEGLINFQKSMGAVWKDTAVLCITEFGRTVKGNGSEGTDHGTASVAFLLGGSVNGGRVAGDWPSLDKLYEGRDLIPANDLRALLKTTLHQHLSISEDKLENSVFPNSTRIWLKEKLFM